MRCKVVDAAVQRGHLGVIRFGDFYFEFLVKPNDEVQEVHGIDVELVANSQFRLNLRQVGLRSNLTKDAKNRFFDLVLRHSFSGSCKSLSTAARKMPPRWPSLTR